MFGYVTPCKMELKIKDYEKFKGYYCGLCKAIKKNYGNLPRMTLNYDMTFLAVLLDSLNDNKLQVEKQMCTIHPFKRRLVITNNDSLDYAAFCNMILSYYKILDNVKDDNSKSSKFLLFLLKHYLKKTNVSLDILKTNIKDRLDKLNLEESNNSFNSLDEISHYFADLTGYIISFYADYKNLSNKEEVKTHLYWMGYNLGKWIYIIDAWDDLEKDMKEKKYNAINQLFNTKQLNFVCFSKKIEERIDLVLLACASSCADVLRKIPISKNADLLSNILQLGLMEKMDKVFKRSELSNAKSL